MIDPDIIASSYVPRGTLFFPVRESRENNTLCQGQYVHGSSCEIIQPVLIAVPDKNILSRMPLMPIPVEKAIPLRVAAVPAFPTHIFYGVTLQGEENILSELGWNVWGKSGDSRDKLSKMKIGMK
jgi:hypothetical protein